MLIVSGDRESEVRYLADRVGIREIYASQSPEDKVEIVRRETVRGKTLFLGDGINDAPALTAATVGVAFGQNSDITAEAAGAVVLDSSLGRFDEFLHVGRRMRRIALQIALGGMALSLIGMGFAAAGYLPPVAGAVAQEVIDLAAVLNALARGISAPTFERLLNPGGRSLPRFCLTRSSPISYYATRCRWEASGHGRVGHAIAAGVDRAVRARGAWRRRGLRLSDRRAAEHDHGAGSHGKHDLSAARAAGARPLPGDANGRLAAWAGAALLPAFRGRASKASGHERPLADHSGIGKPTGARRCPMSTTIVELSPSLQSLVDERLDTIEQVLLVAGVSRGERRGIVAEVESHVFELLGRRTSVEPGRADVLSVLAQLDPPESYAPEGFDRRKLEAGWPAAARERQLSLAAVSSAALGAFIIPALAASALVFELETVSFVLAFALVGVSIAGCGTLVRIHRSQGWLYGRRAALFAALLAPLLMLNGVTVLCLNELGEVAMLSGIAIAFLTFNGLIVYAAWRVCESTCPPLRSPAET